MKLIKAKRTGKLIEEAITSSVPELSKTGCWAGQPRLWPKRSNSDSHRDLKAYEPVNYSQYLPQDTQKLFVAFLSPVLSNNKTPFLCFLLLEPRPSTFPRAVPISMLPAPALTHLQTLPVPWGGTAGALGVKRSGWDGSARVAERSPKFSFLPSGSFICLCTLPLTGPTVGVGLMPASFVTPPYHFAC